MGAIHLAGLPAAYTDWVYCYGLLQPLMPTDDDAKILAAIGGPESGYDYHIVNDTPATGDYSVGIWQINYYGSLYPGRTAAYGTPRHLLEAGPLAQARAAADIWHSQGFMAWATTYTSGAWRKYIGTSGPVTPTGPGGGLPPNPIDSGKFLAGINKAIREMAKFNHGLVNLDESLRPIGGRHWRP